MFWLILVLVIISFALGILFHNKVVKFLNTILDSIKKFLSKGE